MGDHNILLTSSEVSNLWASYIGDSMSICLFEHFISHVEDGQVREIVEQAMDLSKQHVNIIKHIFEDEGIAVPMGFTNEDVNKKAPRLFADQFYLHYIRNMTKGAFASYGAVLPNVFRQDIREYYMSCISSAMELYNNTAKLMVKKGIEVRAPYIPYPKKVEFVEKQKFLNGFLGEKRPLTGIEITHLFANVQTNSLGQALTIAFAQVAKMKEVKNYMLRGNEIAKKHTEIFSEYLKKEGLPIPMASDHFVTESVKPTFSDKLLMYHVGLFSSTGMGNYGAAMSLSPRRDLALDYFRLVQEVALFAEDGTKININHQWMERPPQNADRDELTK